MTPQCHSALGSGTFISLHMQHALPDPGEVSEVEDVVEFRRGWQHLDLSVCVERMVGANSTLAPGKYVPWFSATATL